MDKNISIYTKIITKLLNRDFLKQDKAFFEYGLFDFDNEKIFLDKENFHKIQKDNQKPKICFVDGGSSELIRSPDISLFLIRIVGVIFCENKNTNTTKKEFFVLITTTEKNKRLHYQFETYNNDEQPIENFTIDLLDTTMSFGGRKVEISQVGNLIRQISELKLTASLISELDKGDVLVLDGNLDMDNTQKTQYLLGLYEQANKKKINVCALSKTCNILTNKGRSIITAISDLGPEQDEFFYHPVCIPNKEQDIAFVKLNKDSDYLFRLDFLKGSDMDLITCALSNNSIDFAFPGYPYGLVVADKFARISNQEKEYNLTTFKTKAGDKWKIIKKHINTLNAHDILDSLS